jgi:hypothetical protein
MASQSVARCEQPSQHCCYVNPCRSTQSVPLPRDSVPCQRLRWNLRHAPVTHRGRGIRKGRLRDAVHRLLEYIEHVPRSALRSPCQMPRFGTPLAYGTSLAARWRLHWYRDHPALRLRWDASGFPFSPSSRCRCSIPFVFVWHYLSLCVIRGSRGITLFFLHLNPDDPKRNHFNQVDADTPMYLDAVSEEGDYDYGYDLDVGY